MNIKWYLLIAIITFFSLLSFHNNVVLSAQKQANSDTNNSSAVEQINYDDYFTSQAVRVDLWHSGTGNEDHLAVDEVVIESIWPGTTKHLIDPLNFGKYRFRVFDLQSNKLIFSQGYCTIFGEWLTTQEAADGMWRAMNESVRFPYPKKPVKVIIDSRSDETGEFQPILEIEVDPESHLVSRERKYDFPVLNLVENGIPQEKVDIVILPDGYTQDEMEKFQQDLQRFVTYFFRNEPYNRMRDRFNIRTVLAPSRESGTDEPRKRIFRDTIVNTTFNTLDSARYLTTLDNKSMRELASLVPYDTIYIMVNTSRYGGGGIYNFYSVFPSDNEYSEYVFIHEFGHGFGGLGDEYYDSPTSYDEDNFYRQGVEPWEPNITAQTKREDIKWNDLISPDTPIPTPDEQQYSNVVGLFEGAGYKAKGLYRSSHDCIMFHKRDIPYCEACMRAVEQMIHYFTGEEI